MLRPGFAPLLIVLISLGALVTTGGGVAGVRYYQSNQLSRQGLELHAQGRYQEAAEKFRRSISLWPKSTVKVRLAKSLELETENQEFRTGLDAYLKKNWVECIETLKGVSGELPQANEARQRSEECQKNLDSEKTVVQEVPVVPSKNQPLTNSQAKKKATSTSTPTTTQSDSPSPSQNNTTTSSPGCTSNANPTFSAHITDVSKVVSVVVPPRIISGHLKTHSYLNTEHQNVPIYAPAAASLYGGVYLDHGAGAIDYGLDLKVSCEVMLRFGHITNPIQKIKDAFGPVPQTNSITKNITPIDFAAGELLGYTTGTVAAGNWDFGVYNSTTRNRFADDPSWNNSAIYTTAVCPYDYFSASLKSTYSTKYLVDFGNSILYGDMFCS